MKINQSVIKYLYRKVPSHAIQNLHNKLPFQMKYTVEYL